MDYLNHHGKEKEKLERLQLVALKFKMFRELARVKEQQALNDLLEIKSKSLGKRSYLAILYGRVLVIMYMYLIKLIQLQTIQKL